MRLVSRNVRLMTGQEEEEEEGLVVVMVTVVVLVVTVSVTCEHITEQI